MPEKPHQVNMETKFQEERVDSDSDALCGQEGKALWFFFFG